MELSAELIEGDPRIGALVADRYRVMRKLGEGGMGVVYLAVHEALRKSVAIKLLEPAGRLDRESIARFEREAIAAANLRHPNIAEATDFGRLPDGALYLVMEYVEGTTLRRLLGEEGALPPARAIGILRQVAAALTMAHAREVVHRDLKPENVIVVSTPDADDQVKVIDFGIARIRSAMFGGASAALTRAGTVFGTPHYMAPEQVMGQAVDARADQYALGVLAFEAFTGKQPFAAEDVGQVMMMHVGAPVPSTRDSMPTLAPGVDAVITKMLGKLPDERFASVDAAIKALASAFATEGAPPAESRRGGAASPPAPPSQTFTKVMPAVESPPVSQIITRAEDFRASTLTSPIPATRTEARTAPILTPFSTLRAIGTSVQSKPHVLTGVVLIGGALLAILLLCLVAGLVLIRGCAGPAGEDARFDPSSPTTEPTAESSSLEPGSAGTSASPTMTSTPASRAPSVAPVSRPAAPPGKSKKEKKH